MLYLLDASLLMELHRDYYPTKSVPQFWKWLEAQAEKGLVAIPHEIHDEIVDAKQDGLSAWASDARIKKLFLLDEDVDRPLVNRVVNEGYAPDLTDEELAECGRDPFLIAYGLAKPNDRCVVTREVSKPTKKRGRAKIPDVCKTLNVKCANWVEVRDALGFDLSQA